jgi:hypothetical protein
MAGKGSAGWVRSDLGRAGQVRAGHSWGGQGRQARAGKTGAGQGKQRQGRAG